MAHRHDGTAGSLRVEVLGPLRLVVDGQPVEVPGPRRRAVLALLALAEGRAVSVDELLDAAWTGELPDSGRRALHSHVSRLRGHLGTCAERLRREGDAYRLELGPGELDAAEARSAAESDDVEELARVLRLWRGAALEEFADVAPLAAEAVGLGELHQDLTDRWLEARLAAGGDAELVADATRAAAASPLRERTLLVLVRALAAEGRQAEAMRAAHAFRQRLAEETGFDPTPALDDVERSIAAGALLRVEAGSPPREVTPPDSPLIGRALELEQLRHRLAEGRLVTMVGTGGVGKTRLALELAAEQASGDAHVAVAELAGASDWTGAVEAVAAATGVRAPGPEDALAAVRSLLAGRPALVVLDNCEHLLDDARAIAADLLDAGNGVRVLATSREPLGLPAEHLLRLGPLPVPDASHADPRGVAAFEAFLAHARRRRPDYEPDATEAAAIAEVARRLDGLPLALELAAGRVGSLAVGDLRDRLGRALDVLDAGRHRHGDRHSTLRSTIDWSYRLLSPAEQRLLRALALLPAGFDLFTAERVAAALGVPGDAAAAVAHLVDASVVVADVSGPTARYGLLETIRAFALDELDAAGDRAEIEAALVDWARQLTTEIGRLALGPTESQASARLQADMANLAAVRERAGAEARAHITLELQEMVTFGGHPELAVWALELAERDDLADHPERAQLLGLAAEAAWLRGELVLAERLAEESEALAVAEGRPVVDEALSARGTVALFRGDLDGARQFYERAATLTSTPAVHLAIGALAAVYAGDEARAAPLLAAAARDAAASGTPSHQASVCYVRGELESRRDPEAAAASYSEAIELARLAGTTFIEGTATVGLVSLWGRQGRLGEALEGYRWLVDYWRRAGNWVQLWTTLRNLASALADAEDPHCALFVLAAAEHAPEAALVDADTAAVHDELRARLVAALGEPEAERVRARAAALPRTAVVDEALEAVEYALAGKGPAPRRL